MGLCWYGVVLHIIYPGPDRAHDASVRFRCNALSLRLDIEFKHVKIVYLNYGKFCIALKSHIKFFRIVYMLDTKRNMYGFGLEDLLLLSVGLENNSRAYCALSFTLTEHDQAVYIS